MSSVELPADSRNTGDCRLQMSRNVTTDASTQMPEFRSLIIPLSIVFHLLTLYLTFKLVIKYLIHAPRPNVEVKHIFLAVGQLSRIFYSLIVSGFTIYSMVNDYASMISGFVSWRTSMAEAITLFTIGFHISDTVIIVLSDYIYGLRHRIFVLHHLLMLILYSVIYVTGQCYVYGISFLIVEIIVPFISVQIMSMGLRLRFSDSKLFHLNNAFVIHLFHLRHGFEFLLGLFLYWNRRGVDLGVFVCLSCHLFLMFVFITPYWTFYFTLNTFRVALGRHRNNLMDNDVKKD